MAEQDHDAQNPKEAVKRLKEEIQRLKLLLELQAMKVRAIEMAAKRPGSLGAGPAGESATSQKPPD